MEGGEHGFSRYGVLANLIKLNLAQGELCNPRGADRWYFQLGDANATDLPTFVSSYRDTLCITFVDVFVDDGEGNGVADPDLVGIEPGSNAHLERLAMPFCPPLGNLFSDKMWRNFTLLENPYVQLPEIIEELEAQEAAMELEWEAAWELQQAAEAAAAGVAAAAVVAAAPAAE